MPDGLAAGRNRERVEQQVAEDRWRIVRFVIHGAHVDIVWGDGFESPFHAVWLRDNCACPECRDPRNGQRRFDIAALPPDLSVVEAGGEHETTVTFTFAPDGHRARLDAAWPRTHCYSEATRRTRRDTRRKWGSELGEALPESDYAEVRASNIALARWLENVSELGFAVLRGVPLEDGAVAHVAELFGFVRETNYGRVFDIVNKPSPSNLAFTNQALGVHTDNPYRDPSPGLQLLHCMASSPAGGATILVDGFNAAERLRAAAHAHFTLLSSYEVPFRFRDAAADLCARGRMITVSPEGEIIAVRYNSRSLAALDLPADIMTEFYAAYRHFGCLLRQAEAELVFHMAPGDLLIMDNHRVLHGRRHYADDAHRHLQGCYADKDALDSFLRMSLPDSVGED